MSNSLCPFDAYYHSPDKSYLVKDHQNNWMPVSEKSLTLRLVADGYSRQPVKGQDLSVAEQVLLKIQNHHNIVYHGPLAGYDAGLHKQGGQKVLVTQSPFYVDLIPGNWDLIRAFLTGMFRTPEVDQTPFVHIWLKQAVTAFRSKLFIPGPATAIAGPGKSGKTLFSKMVTYSLGDRSASPHRYMLGHTQFNSEIFGSECLVIDDEQPSKDLRTRRLFGTFIKNMLFGGFQSCHGKKTNALSLQPFWRMLILLNDEPENLMVLPPIDDSLMDKIILLKSVLAPMPMPASTPEERSAFWKALQAEIPHYLHWLLHEFSFSHPLTDTRTGVVSYKHPTLLSQISALAPETSLKSFIGLIIFHDNREFWCGTAEELTRDLLNSDFKQEVSRLLSWPNATGTYLGRLAKAFPDQIKNFRKSDVSLWRISRLVKD